MNPLFGSPSCDWHYFFCCLHCRYVLLLFGTCCRYVLYILVGARYVWDHLYRTPHSNTHASYCVWCFWLETGGEHPFAVSFFYHFGTWFVPPSWPTFMLFTCLLPVPASSKLCMWMATTLLVFDPNISLSHRVLEIYSVHVLFALCMTLWRIFSSITVSPTTSTTYQLSYQHLSTKQRPVGRLVCWVKKKNSNLKSTWEPVNSSKCL